MSIIGKGLGAVALAVAVGLGGAADAAIMRATFSGLTVNYEDIPYDGLGLFGPSGATIGEGVPWSAVFIYDTSGAVDIGCACLLGGGLLSTPSPVRSVTISLNGVDFVLGPADVEGHSIFRSLPDSMAIADYVAEDAGGYIVLALDALSAYPHGNKNVTAWSRAGGTYGYGSFYKYSPGPAYTYLGFAVNSISIAPIPEPATWAILILGFGGVGATFRRRRTVVG